MQRVTDRYTDGRDHFTSATPHAKCNYVFYVYSIKDEFSPFEVV